MLERALLRNPQAAAVGADVPSLPFARSAFELIVCCHFYSHIEQPEERLAFIADCSRVAPALVLVEQPPQFGRPRETWETRSLRDGSSNRVFKRYLPASKLAAEIAGAVLLDTDSFIAVGTGLEKPASQIQSRPWMLVVDACGSTMSYVYVRARSRHRTGRGQAHLVSSIARPGQTPPLMASDFQCGTSTLLQLGCCC